MKTINLVTAVLLAIREKCNASLSFSSYEITQRVREQAKNSEVALRDRATLALGGYDIPHFEVSELVRELFDNNLLPVTRNSGAGYYIYTPDNSVVQASPAPVVIPTSAPTLTPASTTTTNSGDTTQTSVSAVINPQADPNTDSEDKTDLILGYIGRKLEKGQYPSLKNVQSRLKGYSISTEEIQKLCLEKGYQVQPLTGRKPSLSIIYK